MIKNLKYQKTLEFAIIEGSKFFDDVFYKKIEIFLNSIKFDKNALIVASKVKPLFGIWLEGEDKKEEIYNSARFVLVFNNDRIVIENAIKTGGIPLFFYSGQRQLAKIKWAGGETLKEIILKLKKICEKYWWYNRKIERMSKKYG